MAERNRFVPYPDLEFFAEPGSLDRIILNLAADEYPEYNSLPEQLTAGTVEQYANWLSSLTAADPHHQERGVVPHWSVEQRRIIFPTNPEVGKDAVGGPFREKDTSSSLCITFIPMNLI